MNGEWISASDARRLALERYEGAAEAELCILRLAKDGKVRTRAEEISIGNPARSANAISGEIPQTFWEALVAAGFGENWLEHGTAVRWQDWQAACFSLSVEGQPYAATGVSFALEDLLKSLPKPLPSADQLRSRSPSVKSGRPPADECILAKADEMHRRGLRGYEIAKHMRLEDGFSDVSTVAVRDLILGRYRRGPRKKSAV